MHLLAVHEFRVHHPDPPDPRVGVHLDAVRVLQRNLHVDEETHLIDREVLGHLLGLSEAGDSQDLLGLGYGEEIGGERAGQDRRRRRRQLTRRR